MTTVASVEEYREAWRALQAGHFRRGPRLGPPPASSSWVPRPGERVLAVVGCGGGVGASTVALALASAAGSPARVVECCPPIRSGFAAASNAELGEEGAWRRGSRGPVLLERAAAQGPRMTLVPVPSPSTVELTVLDTDWTAIAGADPTDWLACQLRSLDAVVLVTRATVPGIRHLESCAELLPGSTRTVAAVVGPPVKRWPRPVTVAVAAAATRLHVTHFPVDPRLAVTGLTPDPLPSPLLRAGQHLLALLGKEPQ